EADPHRDAGGEQALDGRVGGAANEREGLEQDQVGRVLLEYAGEKADGLVALGRVDVAVDAERHRAVAGAAALLDRAAGEANALAGDVHPVNGAGGIPERGAVASERARQAPGVG